MFNAQHNAVAAPTRATIDPNKVAAQIPAPAIPEGVTVYRNGRQAWYYLSTGLFAACAKRVDVPREVADALFVGAACTGCVIVASAGALTAAALVL